MTPSDLAEAVRLAHKVDDGERTGTRHTMPGGYVATIARALIAAVDQLAACRRDLDSHARSAEANTEELNAAIAASVDRDTELHRECARLEHELDAAITRAEKAEAAVASWETSDFEAERAALTKRAEAALANLHALRDALACVDTDVAWDMAVKYTEELSRQHDADCDVIRARARVDEEIAAWLAVFHPDFAAHIRATWGAREQG